MASTVPGCGGLFDPCPWHGGPAKMQETGREKRDRKIQQVDGNADPAWRNEAEATVLRLAATGIDFTTSDVWESGLRRPREPRALGAVIKHLSKAGHIVPAGYYVNSREPNQNARPLCVWRSQTSRANQPQT
jgi:hypothetical protein